MAQDVVDRVTDRPCRTHRLPLVGAAAPAALRSVAAPARLVRRYGTEAPAVVALADGAPRAARAARRPACPRARRSCCWARRATSSRSTAEDLVDRRTRVGLVPAWRARRRGRGRGA